MNDETPRIRSGSRVKLHLRICLADGTEALSSFGEDALELTFGDGTLVPGLEERLMGLRAGADQGFAADGSELYGPRDNANIHWIDRKDFPPNIELARGQVIAFDAPGGQEVAGMLLDADGEQVQVDFNHPLSGHSLQIRARIISVVDPSGSQTPAPGD